MDSVFVGAIVNDEGIILYAAKTRENLVDQLYEYVDENWADMWPDDKMPGDKLEAVNAYFCDSDESLATEEINLFV